VQIKLRIKLDIDNELAGGHHGSYDRVAGGGGLRRVHIQHAVTHTHIHRPITSRAIIAYP